ncbi:DUF4843 domain-containing protein [Pedobacter sp. ASV12]|uniref:DUF4843 domain-containing protein n=1 Tax=Pedobacter sp. ASV12 TaxID=2795120 RepID=UPI0018EDBD08|nr:DUF4843 domain-containing protein [Pedobacter sp. ASV12]
MATVLLGACKKDGLTTYNDKASKNSIYFPDAKSTNNQVFVSFGYAKSNVKDSIVKILVRPIGAAMDYDRPYNLSIADSSTMKAGTDYEMMSPRIIKAGRVADTLKIKLLRTTTLRSGPLFLYMDLKPNDNFTNDYLSYNTTTNGVTKTRYYTRMTIMADDIAGAPPFWLSGSSYYSFTVGYLGTFSTLKFQLLVTMYNLNVEELVQPNWFLNNGNYRRISGWADGLKAYLNRMAASGTPIYEADGVTPMAMGPNAK